MKKRTFIPLLGALILSGCVSTDTSMLNTPAPVKGKEIALKTAMATGDEAYQTAHAVARKLEKELAGVQPHAIFMLDSFDGLENKKEAIQAVADIFGKELIFGGSVYGVYTQQAAEGSDSISLLAITGDGVQVQAALVTDMGAHGLSLEDQPDEVAATLGAAGAELASKLPALDQAKMMILMGDAHSPKNQSLLDGIQTVTGKKMPITGGSISKNDGSTYLYYRGETYSDSALAMILMGDFSATQQGRQAKSNDAVIKTAADATKMTLNAAKGTPFAMFGFDCAGRMGKLDDLNDELKAIQKELGTTTPLFGSYCAGEFGPADFAENAGSTEPTGQGWHIMTTILSK